LSTQNESAGHRHEVTLAAASPRIDRALAELLPLSRTRIQALIDDGRVEVDGVVVRRASQEVAAGSVVIVDEPPKRTPSLSPEPIPLDWVYEDDDCMVVDKPAGLVVHPAPGHPTGTLVNALLHHRPEVGGVGGERKAGLVHRLDKDTSGCLLVAKNDRAHHFLADQFAARTVTKQYWAFIWGHLSDEGGVFDAPIGRAHQDRQRMSTRTRRGRSARTAWRVVERYLVADYVELTLETGRTHQVRVHLSDAGHPVLGDTRYGGGPARARGFHGAQQAVARQVAATARRQALHAHRLAFDRLADGSRVQAEAPLPADLVELRALLRQQPVA
jgi:23S rRNA pseudouridine1911/1915/1917 synthase